MNCCILLFAFTIFHDLHSQKIKYIIVPLGVQWLVTGTVPSRVQYCTLTFKRNGTYMYLLMLFDPQKGTLRSNNKPYGVRQCRLYLGGRKWTPTVPLFLTVYIFKYILFIFKLVLVGCEVEPLLILLVGPAHPKDAQLVCDLGNLEARGTP